MYQKIHRQILALTLVLALLIAACLGIRAWTASDNAAGLENPSPAISLDLIDNITGISWSKGDVTFSFEKEEAVWKWAEDHAFPLLSSQVENIVLYLGNISASRAIEITEDLSNYGLAGSDTIRVVLTNDAGESTVLLLGAAVGENYYAMEAGGSCIYVVTSTLISYLTVSLYDMADLDMYPSLTQDTVKTITVSGAEESVLSVTATGNAESPYMWTCNGKDVTGSPLISSLRGEFENIDFLQLGGFRESEDLVAQCGLADPITVTIEYASAEGTSRLCLSIGNLTEDGGHYYVSPDDGISIFYIEKEKVDSLAAVAELGFDAAAAEIQP